jgi:multidrug efflux pump subunit AcrA (membrane-fusion protein)
MGNLRRRVILGVGALAVMLGTAAIVRTLVRQSRGPIAEDFRASQRISTYPGAPPVDSSYIEGNGVVEPRAPESRLGADVAGRIAAVYVKEGDPVEKGTLLGEVENAVQRAAVSRAEAELAAATGELARAARGMRAQDINAVEAEASSAKARAALAESELARTQELVGKGSLGAAELGFAQKRLEAETAAARAATERALGARAGGRFEDISVAQARIHAATAALAEARGALQRTLITSPISGKVLRLRLHVGEFHDPSSSPLAVVGDVSRLRVRMDVDERDIGRIAKDAPVIVTAPSSGAARFPGKVVEISQRMGRRTVRVDDPKDRVDVKVLETLVELDGAPPLVPGMRVSVRVRAKDAQEK